VDERAKALEVLKRYNTAMLVTHGADGLDARPMQIARMEEDGRLWFLSGERSRKVDELNADSSALVVCQEDRGSYISVRGTARVLADRARARDLWQEPYRVWFPGGPDDPDLVVIDFDPEWAEYWDQEGTNKVRYMFKAAAAYARGRRPAVDDDQHGETTL
jgi:general stress protein 26